MAPHKSTPGAYSNKTHWVLHLINQHMIVCCSFEYPTIPYLDTVTLHSHKIFLPAAHSLSTASVSYCGVSASKEGHSLRQRWTHPHHTRTGKYNSLLVQFTVRWQLMILNRWSGARICYVNCMAVCTCSGYIYNCIQAPCI